MTQMDLKYLGDLRTELIHVESGATLLTDAPKDNHGKGESFSPTDLLASALLSCMVTLMGIYAQKLKIDLKNVEGSVRKAMSDSTPRRISKLEVFLKVSGNFSDEEKKALVNAADHCPVHHSLSSEIDVQVRYEWSA